MNDLALAVVFVLRNVEVRVKNDGFELTEIRMCGELKDGRIFLLGD